ncbi:MAG: hypothetical protein A2Y56_09690 [Candidatus Aminicenantes bacterium RBG_13_63_10]|nr:MAG: hypothetical protein A2Y56_09690 [Candidatus Aminicenantes bacterium RBG_13_63_10]
MEAFDLESLLTFSGTSPTKKVFFESERIKAQVMGLEPGQEIPPCRMDHDVLFVILDGRGVILADGEEMVFEKSSFLFVPKECGTRSLRAQTKTAVLAVQVKS